MNVLNDTMDVTHDGPNNCVDNTFAVHALIDEIRQIGIGYDELQLKIDEYDPDHLQSLKDKELELKQKNEEVIRNCVEHKHQFEQQLMEKAEKKEITRIATENNESDLKKMVQDRHEMYIACYKFLLNKLNLTMRCKFAGSSWDIEYARTDGTITFNYNSDLDKFELCDMKPMVSTFEQIKDLLKTNNDITGVLCAWVSYVDKHQPI